MNLYAHTGPSGSLDDGQTLEDHLVSVAKRCAGFAKVIGYEQWGYALGLLHDAGKASQEFQQRLAGSKVRVDHATAGARLCKQYYGGSSIKAIVSTLMSLAVVGHHGGLPNVNTLGKRTTLTERLSKDIPEYQSTYSQLLEDAGIALPGFQEFEPVPPLKEGRILPDDIKGKGESAIASLNSFSLQLLGRLLFSCLVDADYLDTERCMSPEVHALRVRDYACMEKLLSMLECYMSQLTDNASSTPVNEMRAQILNDCKEAAHWNSGLFTLSVPTGGGKTLSSIMFALMHAVLHSKQRVIYAIPFTTVAQQTAKVFQSIFGEQNVLEHHSGYASVQFDIREEDESNELSKTKRLATQNWDAPIIVTTNVQLLESFYANTPGKCRKLHNVANSVIVFDEVQTLPDALLMPTLALLEDLCIDYSTSIVMCSATQPALKEYWPFGSRPREISVHQERFDEVFASRVRFEPLIRIKRAVLAEDLCTKYQVLCVVGTKNKARNLYKDVVQQAKEYGVLTSNSSPMDDGFFHLSTDMVAAHRMSVLQIIKSRLASGNRCVVVSTQLIEAGVDLDFMEVYREIAGIDSLMQAAGRCNREGQLTDEEGCPRAGIVHVFEFEEDLETEGKGLVRTWLGAMKSISKNLLESSQGIASEELIEPFFMGRYKISELDQGNIFRDISNTLANCCGTLEYERYAHDYKIIEDNTESVYVPWDDEGRCLLDYAQRLSASGESGALIIPLQRYAVGVYPHILGQLEKNGDIEKIGDYHVLVQDAVIERYSAETGLLPVGEGELNNLIV